MLEGVKFPCYFDVEGNLEEGSVEMCLDPNDESICCIEMPRLSVSVSLDNLKKAMKRLDA